MTEYRDVGPRLLYMMDADNPQLVYSERWRLAAVTVESGGKYPFYGSGFVMIRQIPYVITCDHIIRKIQQDFGDALLICTLLASTRRVHPSSLFARDAEYDLAILTVDASVKRQTVERIGVFNLGDKVFSIGYDDDRCDIDAPVHSQGTVRAEAAIAVPGQPLVSGFLIDGVNAQLGASGSPIFDASGRILGYVKGNPNLQCFAIPIRRALDLLGQAPPMEGRSPSGASVP